eukprot:jgi/Tetstr1/463645/TSEL_008506.t1
MANVWGPFFDCAHISENTSFNAADRSKVFHPHLQGKLTRFPIEFFPLTTNSACFTEGNVAQILSYHVPGMSAFLLEVDHEDEARRRKHETARTMAAAKEMRHWNPEAHIGDDEYILSPRTSKQRWLRPPLARPTSKRCGG